MTELRWTRDSTFHDGERNFRATGPGVYDVPEEAVDDVTETLPLGLRPIETLVGLLLHADRLARHLCICVSTLDAYKHHRRSRSQEVNAR